MSLKKFVAALAAVSLAAAPTMAVAQVEGQDEPRVDSGEGGGGPGVGQVLPILAIIAIVLLIREIVKDRDMGDPPISP